ncbi:uncharacterized protein [Temnothorax nylanderi]|uniref:uncharacterized protein n=2 Tax=Temnothorax nylanderi TaxID=102681 RepID=UPI003A8704AF
MDALPGGSRNELLTYKRREIFFFMRNCLSKEFSTQIKHLEQELSEQNNCSIQIHPDARSHMSTFFSKLRAKWQKAKRTMKFFLQKNENWLEVNMSFPIRSDTDKLSVRGRPSLDFGSSSERSKRRKTEDLRRNFTTEELSYATQMSLRSSGNLHSAQVVKDVTTSPTRALLYKKAFQTTVETTLSANVALSIMVEAKLTKKQYNIIRSSMKKHNCRLYPNYNAVRAAKELCYPPRFSITITESSADIKLQDLLDHTCERLLFTQREVIRSLNTEMFIKADLICKWGCNESPGQSEYKQKFNDKSTSDANVFLTSLVPLQLKFAESNNETEIIIWKNPRPSSPRFCRPIRLQFLHEDTQSTVNEVEFIEQQITSLVPFEIVIDGKEITVNYQMLFTITDGKVCNAVTSTPSTLRCYLCGATSKDFNNIDKILTRDVEETNLCFGMSTLHAWIRLFECLLHLSYKLSLKKWQARTKDEKELISQRKADIQKGFRSELGLIVDRPTPGYGSTNDGTTARCFFKNSAITALITGLNEEIIKRFHIILQAISSGHDIDVDNYKKYALETAKMFVSEYPWYNMPTTVHKLLIHGPQIIASALLPIGQLSEEAREACKDVKKYREGFSRKCSREKTMEDVLNWLLVSSDPYISSLRKLPKKKLKELSPEAIQLLLSLDLTATDCEDSDKD